MYMLGTKKWNKRLSRQAFGKIPPETLAFYRTVYDDYIQSYLKERARTCRRAGSQGLTSGVTLTRNSLIAENLYIAGQEPLCTAAILDKVFDKIAEIAGKDSPTLATEISTNQLIKRPMKGFPMMMACAGQEDERRNVKDGTDVYEPNELYIYNIACTLAEGHLRERQLKLLKTGFDALLRGERSPRESSSISPDGALTKVLFIHVLSHLEHEIRVLFGKIFEKSQECRTGKQGHQGRMCRKMKMMDL
jgi:hypothetical protein